MEFPAQTKPPRFDVFLSHNSHDKPFVERLAEKLKRTGVEPWLDKWCLTPGVNWQEELAAGLRVWPACAVFVGPQGLGDWAREELGVALDRAAKDHTFRLFLVLLPALPEPFDASTLPPFLTTRTWVDLRNGIDQARAFQSLINAIKGIPLGPEVPIERGNDICPYLGLRPFDEEHAEFYFGRDADIQRLTEKLKVGRFLAVLGPSGSGKSSLVRAGLLPALRNDVLPDSHSWRIRVLVPGARPLETLGVELSRLSVGGNPLGETRVTLDQLAVDTRTLHLAASLALAGRRTTECLVWVVDQCEEVFTLCRDERERTQFFNNLLYAASIPDGRSIVILTMRADFYSKCAAYPELSTRIAAQQFLVSPMSGRGVRQAIEEPARHVGMVFEEGLVETISRAVENQPGTLPLLEHALLELWERRRGQMLTLEAYRESGGVEGAIAKRADAIYDTFSPEQQKIARRIMLRLTQPGDGTEDTRRRATMSELITRPNDADALEDVVRSLVAARLLTMSGDEFVDERWVDVSHEALIRGWPRLREWIDKDRAGLQLHSRLAEAAKDWQRSNRDEYMLYRGARLMQAVEWNERNETELSGLERAFLDASVALRVRDEEEEKERQRLELEVAQQLAATERERADAAQALAQSEKKAHVRQRYYSAGLSGVLVIMIVTAFLAYRAQRVAKSRALAATALNRLESAPELALALSIEANDIATTDEARDSLRQALTVSRVGAILRHGGPVKTAVFSPDSRNVVTASDDSKARVWDAVAGRLIAELGGHGATVNSASFDPTGRFVVTASDDTTSRIWDAVRGEQLFMLEGHKGPVKWAEFRADGRRIVTASDDGSVRVWDVETRRQVAEMSVGKNVYRASYDTTGSTIVTAGSDGATLADGELRGQIALAKGLVFAATFSPLARLVAAGVGSMSGGTALVWSLEALNHGKTNPLRLPGHTKFIRDLAFSPDGHLLGVASDTESTGVWNVPEQTFTRLQGHQFDVHSIRFNHDGTLVVTASQDGTSRIWNPSTGTQIAALYGHSDDANIAEFSPRGDLIVTASSDGTARVWRVDLIASPIVKSASDLAPFAQTITTSPEDGGALIGYADGTVRTWNPGQKAVTRQFGACTDNFLQKPHFVVDHRNRHVWTTCGEVIRKWDANSGQVIAEWVLPHEQLILASSLTAHGVVILANANEADARIFELGPKLEEKAVLRGQPPPIVGAVSADGSLVATGTMGAGAALWSAGSGELMGVLAGHSERITSVAFSADASRVVTGSWDRTARVWDVASRKVLATLAPHSSYVFSAKFSPDGRFVATGEQNGTVRVWEVPAGRLVTVFKPHHWPINDLTFTANGAAIATVSNDGGATLFPCHACGALSDLLEKARRHIPAGFDRRTLEVYTH